MNTDYDSPMGHLSLNRYPLFPKSRAQQNLQAWDGADTLLLEYIKSNLPHSEHNVRILILNDQFGAITCGLASLDRPIEITSQSDSYLSQEALRRNLKLNVSHSNVTLSDSTEDLSGTFDLILIRIPKNLNFLEDQLYKLRNNIAPETRIIACSMVKGLSPNTRHIFDGVLGPSEQSLAARKARLIHCSPKPETWKGESPFPKFYSYNASKFTNLSNVFSHASIDPGTRVFLSNIEKLPQSETLIDLASGNGIMGISASKHCNTSKAFFVDESHMAIASSKFNCQKNAPDLNAEFICSNSIAHDLPIVDLIVCNPPFHQQQTMMTDMAIAMFNDAKKHLNRAGELWVIANRHLGYHAVLKKMFGNCENMANDKKYVLLKCVNI